jgi:hypothetical protein
MNPTQHVDVAVPRTWATRSDPGNGIVVAARARELPPSGIPPELVVRTVAVSADLATWRAEALDAIAGQLDGFELEDADEFPLGDHEVAYGRFAFRSAGTAMVCEQWAWLVDGLGVTLTGSVARSDYPTYCELFEDVAATLEVRSATPAHGGGRPGSGRRGGARW